MNYLMHHGIKGQKWGVRRFQNEDGSWTAAGKKRYGSIDDARNQAKAYASEARKNKEEWSRQLTGKSKRANKNVKDSDLKRWIKASEAQEKMYNELEKRYGSMKIENLNKKTIKEAKDFLKKGFVDADYADYWYGGRWNNYLLNKG